MQGQHLQFERSLNNGDEQHRIKYIRLSKIL